MSRTDQKKTPSRPQKNGKRLGVPAKIGILLLVAAVGFLFAEHRGLTGTHFIFKNESSGDARETRDAGTAFGETPDADGKKRTPSADTAKRNAGDAKKSADGKSDKRGQKASSSRKAKSEKTDVPAAKKSARPPVPPLPRSAFPEISRRPHTWPAFVRLTRSRSIAIVDQQSGVSMGRMEIPAGTVVKIRGVGADGTLDVFDRTGQTFRIEASGTNFAAALEAVKNSKAKRKTKPKKAPATVAKAAPETEPAPTKAGPAPAESPKTPKKFISVFGTLEEDDWDDADDE